MSWGGHNDDGYVEFPSDDFADEQYLKEREAKSKEELRMSIAAVKYLDELRKSPDGHPITHIDGISVGDIEKFIATKGTQ